MVLSKGQHKKIIDCEFISFILQIFTQWNMGRKAVKILQIDVEKINDDGKQFMAVL